MREDVKRYDSVGYDGLSAMMKEHPESDYVRAEDYDALAEKLKHAEGCFALACKEMAAVHDALGLPERDFASDEDEKVSAIQALVKRAELAEAELAALKGAAGEPEEVVAFIKRKDGKRWRLYWEDEFLPGDEIEKLMTVAQHQRIVAAMARDAEGLAEALEDMLWCLQVRPSCQRGLVERCRCASCSIPRSQNAIAAHRAGKEGKR